MSKKNHDEPKEEVSEPLSEWQKRNKEYLEKKAQEEAIYFLINFAISSFSRKLSQRWAQAAE